MNPFHPHWYMKEKENNRSQKKIKKKGAQNREKTKLKTKKALDIFGMSAAASVR